MKIKFLGTGAAEGVPALFCSCKVCEASRRLGGRNIRSRSQALIDDKLLIEFNADTFYHTIKYNINLTNVHTCLITHNHSDHLYPGDIEMRRVDFCYLENETPLTFYAGKSGAKAIQEIIDRYNLENTNRVKVVEYKAYEPFVAEGYTITPLPATHEASTSPHILLIEKDNKTLLYAHDSSCFKQEVFDYLQKENKKIDLATIDCTFAMTDQQSHVHMSYDNLLKQVEILTKIGVMNESTIIVANHFTHNKTMTYDEMIKRTEYDDVKISYDGLEIEF